MTTYPKWDHFWLTRVQGDPECSAEHPCDAHKFFVFSILPAAAAIIACDPSNPCGCYGCAVCNGAQAPYYPTMGIGQLAPQSTPPYGSPVASACGCGSATCNNCRAARGMGPAGVTPYPGRAKPNGGGSPRTRAANAEKGYRVLPYADWLNKVDGTREGDVFSTPDLATQRARKGAKEGKQTFLVMRDGARWKLLKADGDEVVIG